MKLGSARAMLRGVKGIVFVLGVALTVGCAKPRSNTGARCARNSQCAAPLVCALERCRVECNSSRDCPVGSSCVRSESGQGVCLLPAEMSCDGDGECPDSLVCGFGRCTNSCDAGCPPGNECREMACFDPLNDARCSSDVDCSASVCIAGRCVRECLSSRDCRFGVPCMDGRCSSVPLDASFDVPGIDGSLDGAVDPFCPPQEVDVVDVCIGDIHACAVLTDGRVVCWGDNATSQLGNSTVPLAPAVFAATFVDGLANAVRVECGSYHTCALDAAAQLRCWGTNTGGQLGAGSLDASSASPLNVPLTDVRDFDLRVGGGCAISGTQVWCWGTNDNQQLGRGVMGSFERSPVMAMVLPQARSVSTFDDGGYVISTTGDVVRFGADLVPLDLTLSFDDAVDVSAGGDGRVGVEQQHVCILREAGEVHCAGDNARGQLGDPLRGGLGGAFAIVPGLTGATSIRARATSMCVVTDGGGFCWGENTGGGLGVGDELIQSTPAALSLEAVAPTAIEARSEFGCAVFAGTAYCFGASDGERGRRGLQPRSIDSRIPTLPVRCLP